MSSDFEVTHLVQRDDLEPISSKIDVLTCSKRDFSAISSMVNPDGFLAVLKVKAPRELDERSHIFVLDGIRDPGNLGTIVRTMDWFGFDQIVCSSDCADFYNPKCIASTMGSFLRVTPKYMDLTSLLVEAKRPVYGLDLEGKNIEYVETSKPSIFVFGSESQGLSVPVKKMVSQHLSIKGKGMGESLNVAQAAGILMYQLSLGKT